MKVEVKLFDLLRRYAPDNQNVFHVQLQPGVSVGELLEKLQIPPSVRRIVLVNGRRVALIGTVSMDLISIDLTDVPVANVGDRVVLWGGHLPIEEIAARADTIPYELMCGLSQRVEHRLESAESESSAQYSHGVQEES